MSTTTVPSSTPSPNNLPPAPTSTPTTGIQPQPQPPPQFLNSFRTMISSICTTVVDGWVELIDVISPARKRRRSTSIQPEQHQPLPPTSTPSIFSSQPNSLQHPPQPILDSTTAPTPTRRSVKRIRLSNGYSAIQSNQSAIGLASLTPQDSAPYFDTRLPPTPANATISNTKSNLRTSPFSKTPIYSISDRGTERFTPVKSKLSNRSTQQQSQNLDLSFFRYPQRRVSLDTPAARAITYAQTNEESYRRFQRQRFKPVQRISTAAPTAPTTVPPSKRISRALAIPMKPQRRERIPRVVAKDRELGNAFAQRVEREKRIENLRSDTKEKDNVPWTLENKFENNNVKNNDTKDEKVQDDTKTENRSEKELSLDDFIATLRLGSRTANNTRAAWNRIMSSRDKCRRKKLEVHLHEQSLASIYEKRAMARKLYSAKKPWEVKTSGPEQPPQDGKQLNFNFWMESDPYWDEDEDDEALMERQKKISVSSPKSAFSQLTTAATKRLQRTMCDESNYHQTLSKIDGCVITGEDIRRLKPNSWLNDEIVNAYLALLSARSEAACNENANGNVVAQDDNVFPKIKVMNSFFYARLVQMNPQTRTKEYMYSRVKRWTRRFDVFSYDIMIIPVNMNNVHWTLGVIDFRKKTIEHLDSMGTGGSNKIRQDLLQWVADEAEDKRKPFNHNEWKCVEKIVPVQENTDDCGVFLCKFADFLSRGWKSFTFNQRHMNYFRARIAHELLMAKAT